MDESDHREVGAELRLAAGGDEEDDDGGDEEDQQEGADQLGDVGGESSILHLAFLLDRLAAAVYPRESRRAWCCGPVTSGPRRVQRRLPVSMLRPLGAAW